MNRNHIDDLIKRFLDAQTTEAEEQQLADFFAHADNVPAEWEAVRRMFQSFETDAYELTPDELLPIPNAESPAPKRKARVMYLRLAIAACAAAVFIIAGTYIYNNVDTPKLTHTPTTHATPANKPKHTTPPTADSTPQQQEQAPIEAEPIRRQHRPTPPALPAEPIVAETEPIIAEEVAIPLLADAQEPKAEPIDAPTEPQPHTEVMAEWQAGDINLANAQLTEEDLEIIREQARRRLIAQLQEELDAYKARIESIKRLYARN